MNSKSAFTLAEVLITLGVIGVVAAVTLPTLIKNYQKHAWTNSLKGNYSLLNQGFQKMMADEGLEFIYDTEAFKSIGEYENHGMKFKSCSSNDDINSNLCKDFYNNLKYYFKIVSIGKINNYSYKYLNGINSYVINSNIITLSNGATILNYSFGSSSSTNSRCQIIHSAGGHTCTQQGHFYIDINGKKGPNIYGRDIFYFYVNEKGNIMPYGGNDYAIFQASYFDNTITPENIEKNRANGQSSSNKCDKNLSGSIVENYPNYNGNGCAGYLIDELNWKMDY